MDSERMTRLALDCWQRAREYEADGHLGRSARKYIRGLGRFFSIQVSGHPTVSIYYAFAAMARETALVINRQFSQSPQDGLARQATGCARISLAAAHLMDPANGAAQLAQAAATGDSEPLFKLVLGGGPGPPLTRAERISGAARARVLLAELVLQHRDALKQNQPGWPVGSGGRVRFLEEQRRFQRAVLPNCGGLDYGQEMLRLAEEGVLILTSLCAAGHDYDPLRDHARRVLASIQESLDR